VRDRKVVRNLNFEFTRLPELHLQDIVLRMLCKLSIRLLWSV
jgi:hypothetical protein